MVINNMLLNGVLVKFKKLTITKIIAFIVIIIFTQNQLSWAEGCSKVTWQEVCSNNITSEIPVSSIKIPYEYAETDEIYSEGQDKQIVHIQDAHASLSAQYSIVELLDDLFSKYNLSLIAIEGGQGYIDTSFLKSFPIKKIRKQKAAALMAQGRMGAGEFFSIIKNENNIALYGIEDEDLYWENVNQFRDIAQERKIFLKNIKFVKTQLNLLAEKIFSKELMDLKNTIYLHKDGKISFVEYWKRISGYLERFHVDAGTYQEVSRLCFIIDLEKKIDFRKANIERKELISDLNKRLNKKELEALVMNVVAFKEDRISKSEFHRYLISLAAEYDVPEDGFQNLIRFAKYITLYENLNVIFLHNELKMLEDQIGESLYRNRAESKLFDMFQLIYLLKKLYSIELTSSEYDLFLSIKDSYSEDEFNGSLEYICSKTDISMPDKDNITGMLSGIDRALLFFNTAKKRDRKIILNTIKKMTAEGKNVAALITGGFHSEGLKEIMKEKALSYIIVSPKCKTSEGRPYFAVLSGKKNYYTDTLDADKYNIAVFDFSSNQTPSGMLDDAAQLLAQARFEGLDPQEVADNWKKQYRKLQLLRENNPFRNGRIIMPVDEFDLMIDSLKVRIVSSHIVVLRNGTPFAVYKRPDPASRCVKVRLSQKILQNLKETNLPDHPSQFQAFTHNDLMDLENIISVYKDPDYISSICERLPEKVRRRGVKTSYVLNILKREGMLPQSWSKDEKLVKAIRILVDAVEKQFESLYKDVEDEKNTNIQKGKTYKVIDGLKEEGTKKTEEVKVKPAKRKRAVFDMLRLRIGATVYGAFVLTGFIVSFVITGLILDSRSLYGNFAKNKLESSFYEDIFKGGIGKVPFEFFSPEKLISLISAGSAVAGSQEEYGTKKVSFDAPWKKQTHESSMAVKDVYYDPSVSGTIVDLEISRSSPGQGQGEVFLEPLHSNIRGLSRGYIDLHNKTMTIEVLVSQEMAGIKAQFFAKEDKNWESEYGPEIRLNAGKNFISYTFKSSFLQYTRLMGLKFYGPVSRGKIALGNMLISGPNAAIKKPETVLPLSFESGVEIVDALPVPGEQGVDLKLKEDGFYWHGKKKIIAGANWRVMGEYGYAFGHKGVKPWFKNPVGVKANEGSVERVFRSIQQSGLKKVRVWLLDDGRAVLDKDGHVVGYDRVFKEDVKTFLDLAEKYGIAVEFSLVDYLVAGKPRLENGVWVQGRRNIFTDKRIRKEFVDEFVVPLIKDFGSHPAFVIVDLGNEFEWLVAPEQGGGWDKINDPEVKDKPVPLKDIVAYLQETSAAIRKYAPDMIITGGFNAVSHPGLYKHLEGKVDYIAGHWYPKFGELRTLLSGAKAVSDDINYPIALEEFPSISSEFSKMMQVTSDAGYIGADFWNFSPSIDDQTLSASRLYDQLQKLKKFIASKSSLYSFSPLLMIFSPGIKEHMSELILSCGSVFKGMDAAVEGVGPVVMSSNFFKGIEYFISFLKYSNAGKISLVLLAGTIAYFLWAISKVDKVEAVDDAARKDFMKDLIRIIFLSVSLLASLLISIYSYEDFDEINKKEKQHIEQQKDIDMKQKSLESVKTQHRNTSDIKRVSKSTKSFLSAKNITIGILAGIIFMPVKCFASAGSVISSKGAAKAPISLFDALSAGALIISVVVTAVFLYIAYRNHIKLKELKAKSKFRDVDKEGPLVDPEDIVSALRWKVGSLLGAMGMMVVSIALGERAPELNIIEQVTDTSWFLYTGVPQTFLLIALIGAGIGIKKGIVRIKKNRSKRHIKDIPSGSAAKKTFPEEINTVIGLPLEVYNHLGKVKIKNIRQEIGVSDIVPVNNYDEHIADLEKVKGKVIGVFFDMDALSDYIIFKESKVSGNVRSISRRDHPKMEIFAIDIESLKDDMFIMASKTMKDIMKIMAPEKAGLDLKGVQSALAKLSSEQEIMSMVTFYSRLLPDIQTVDLLNKSAYDVHFEEVNKKALYNVSLTGKANHFLTENINKARPKYISVQADSAADLRFIAGAIGQMGLNPQAAAKFIHVRIMDKNITEGNLGKVLSQTGISYYLPRRNVSLVEGDAATTLSGALEKVKSVFGEDIDNTDIAIGSTFNNPLLDVEGILLSPDISPIFLEMRKEGLVSQTLWVLVELMAHRNDPGSIPSSLGSVFMVKKGKNNWFYYLPNVEAMNFEEIRKEIINYEKILIAA